MNRTIPRLPAGRLPIVGLLAVGAGLFVAESVIPWAWVIPLVVVGGGSVWLLSDRGTDQQPGRVDAGSSEESAALETLKQQYAVGEIGEAEFERRVETLLESRSAVDVADRIDAEPEPATDAVDSAGAARQSPQPTENTQPDRRGATPSGRHGCRRRGKGRHRH